MNNLPCDNADALIYSYSVVCILKREYNKINCKKKNYIFKKDDIDVSVFKGTKKEISLMTTSSRV